MHFIICGFFFFFFLSSRVLCRIGQEQVWEEKRKYVESAITLFLISLCAGSDPPPTITATRKVFTFYGPGDTCVTVSQYFQSVDHNSKLLVFLRIFYISGCWHKNCCTLLGSISYRGCSRRLVMLMILVSTTSLTGHFIQQLTECIRISLCDPQFRLGST